MFDREEIKKRDYRDVIFKQAIMAVYKLIDTVERLEDRLQDIEQRVEAITEDNNNEVEPIFYS